MQTALSFRAIGAAAGILLTTSITTGYLVHFGIERPYYCDGRLMTAAQIATHRGIDPDMLEKLRWNRSLDVADVCTMPEGRLKRAVYRVEHPKPDRPGEWAKLRRLQSQDENGRIPDNALVEASEHVRAMAAAQLETASPSQISPTSWTWIGPGNIGGRIRSILIDPTQPETMYVGSVSGGVWKSTNGGKQWQVLDDFMTNMAVSTMVMDRNDPRTIYAGTGEGFFNLDSIRGAGIFRTTDGGATWKQLASTKTNDFLFVNRLAISANNKAILAATDTGIFRSADKGKTWTKVHSVRTLDADFHPSNNKKAIASGDSGQSWYSDDAGASWKPSAGINTTGGFNNRVEVTYAPSDGEIVYASSGHNNGTVYRSTNGGRTFKEVNTGNAYLGSQAWYDNVIWVDPTNPKLVIVGGIDLWRSTDSGKTFTKISAWQFGPPTSEGSAHADHHAIVHHPHYNGSTNKTVFFGTDGGIFRAKNVKTVAQTSGWTNLNNNLGITQFYGAAGHVASGKIIGGTQDNGTLFFDPSKPKAQQKWTPTFGGDGGFAAAVPGGANPTYFFGEYVYLQIHRSINGAQGNYIYNGITDANPNNPCALFIAPFVLDPNDPNVMLEGGCSLWASNNVLAANPGWFSIKTPSGGMISAIGMPAGTPGTVWVGYTNGDVWKTTDFANNWFKMDGTTLPDRYVTRVAVDPTNTNRVYVTFGGFFDNNTTGNIWRTTDGGQTWKNIHGKGKNGLPRAPIRSVVIHPKNSKYIYVGTEVGVFYSPDRGGSWVLENNGPTNTSVDELFFFGNTLYAATHGRGIFRSKTTPLATAALPEEPPPAPPTIKAAGGWSGAGRR